MAQWRRNGTSDTLTVAGDAISISDLTAKKFNQFFYHGLFIGTPDWLLRFNANSNSVYSRRRSTNGGGSVTSASDSEIDTVAGAFGSDIFCMMNVISVIGEEKLVIGRTMIRNTAGAGTAPQRVTFVGKFVPSPDADVTQVSINNTQASSDYAVDSNLSALGAD